jgi:hypothetical protein
MDWLAKGVPARNSATAETVVNLTGWGDGAGVGMPLWTGM